jgi:hypothetical protein
MGIKVRDPNVDPVIVAAKRTAVGKAKKGALATVRPEDLGAAVIRAVLAEVPQIQPNEIDDVIINCEPVLLFWSANHRPCCPVHHFWDGGRGSGRRD